MKYRQSKKIAKCQEILCSSQFGGSADIRTAGRVNYGECRYRRALKVLIRKMDREMTEKAPGAIERCASYYRQMNAGRVSYLVSSY